MTKKMISWLACLAVFLFTLHSCVHDEIYSSFNPASKEYHSKSLWKEDEIYIKNIIKIYQEYENEIRKGHGNPIWEYAMTMDKFDESYLVVPVRQDGKISEVLEVPRFGRKVYFRYSDNDEKVALFNKLMLDRPKKPLPASSVNEASKIVCVVKSFSMWYPDNESNPSGSGHWVTSSYTVCIDLTIDTFENPDDGSGNGGYDYPPFGGDFENPEDSTAINKTPCEKTRNIINNPQVKDSLNSLRNYAQNTSEKTERGFQQLKSGSLIAGIVNGDNQMYFGIGSSSQGTVHTHQPGTIGIFAPQDIMTFLHIVREQDANNLGNAYSGTVSSVGTYFINFTGTTSDLPPAMSEA